MGRQTWNHVNETRPFRGHGHADNGTHIVSPPSPDRIRARRVTRTTDPAMPRKDALVALALGVALLVVAAMLAVTASHAAGDLIRTPGTVVRIVQDSDAMRAYRPIVAYLANDGRRREVAGNTASVVPAYDIGESVDVLVDPAHPNRPALIDDFTQRWLPVAVPALLAVASLAIGSLLYVNARRGRQADALSAPAARKAVRRRWNIAIVLIPIAIGTGFLAGAGAAGLRQWQIARHYAHSTGHVVEIAETAQSSRTRTSLYSATIAFTTDSGRPVTFAQGSTSSRPGLYEGEVVDVLYDPVTPERAVIDRFWDRWGLTAILFAIGAPFLVAGLFVVGALWPEPRPHELAE
ncbi:MULTISPECIES: DUF3592 domain-containing protein [unclassified Burkholderia]|uniref:DUF3592 domain-containing protein n=1 Tax=unclassified Burkholderia TaxID=2613784 RepID=UPI000F58A75C|nr:MULTISPECIES: DUF3592 domain-containing protein [unclassified Burkholderia]RQR83502.1 DUF3592 domain-containing protein [Burkholderia sp. Bp9011]RQR93251.1 DUF3592 domain-containing protein [Burkholderia sp. Bp9010]RQS04765.1 DUF3592 domain-containing protein [Burkholderia sp. Bp8991]RQS77989.1 DUF3592 domain-containing protein [Burkholderia sp. Bp8977]